MKKQTLLSLIVILFIFFSFSISSFAQSITPTVISPSGGDFSNGAFSVSSTFGEMTAVKTIVSASIITQGFHQPADLATSVSTTPIDIEGISVYPNPTKGLLTLEIENSGNENYHYYIYSIVGKMVKEKEIVPGLSKIDISKMVKGVYFVKVVGATTKQQKTIKITLI